MSKRFIVLKVGESRARFRRSLHDLRRDRRTCKRGATNRGARPLATVVRESVPSDRARSSGSWQAHCSYLSARGFPRDRVPEGTGRHDSRATTLIGVVGEFISSRLSTRGELMSADRGGPPEGDLKGNAPSSRSKGWPLVTTVVLSVVLAIFLITIALLATVPLKRTDETAITWFGLNFTAGPNGEAGGQSGLGGNYCPHWGSSAGLVGNITVSFTWKTLNGQPVTSFYAISTLSYPQQYLYYVNNSASGSAAFWAPNLLASACYGGIGFFATSNATEQVQVIIWTTYTYQTTVTIL